MFIYFFFYVILFLGLLSVVSRSLVGGRVRGDVTAVGVMHLGSRRT